MSAPPQMNSPLFELALVLVRFDLLLTANHKILLFSFFAGLQREMIKSANQKTASTVSVILSLFIASALTI